jgi:hypothetical protein
MVLLSPDQRTRVALVGVASGLDPGNLWVGDDERSWTASERGPEEDAEAVGDRRCSGADRELSERAS